MLRNLFAIVTTWPFAFSLLALLVNDAWLKSAYPGVVSGKLSDFSGIAVVSFLLFTAQPHRPHLVGGIIVAAFAWWKSPLSQPAIDAANLFLPYHIGRTVDYSDLVALLVIPVCAAVTRHPSTFAIPGRTLRRLSLAPLVALTALGLMATSVMPTRQDYQVRRPDSAAELDRESIANTVAEVAAQHGLTCDECANPTGSGRYEGNGIHLRYIFIGTKTISFAVEAFPNGLFFGESGKDKADRLRADLKIRLGSSYKDLEYVERLGSPK